MRSWREVRASTSARWRARICSPFVLAGREPGGHPGKWHVKVAQPGDLPCPLELLRPVEAVARVWIYLSRREQSQLVVVAQSVDR